MQTDISRVDSNLYTTTVDKMSSMLLLHGAVYSKAGPTSSQTANANLSMGMTGRTSRDWTRISRSCKTLE